MSRTPHESTNVASLNDLRRAGAADATLQNLLAALDAKLEFCGRLPVYQYEAASEGHAVCASAFNDLARAERQSFSDLLSCLQRHLNEQSQSGADRATAGGGGS